MKNIKVIDLLTGREFFISVPSHIIHIDKFLEVQDFTFFENVLGDRPSDIDLAFECCGHVLIIEFKRIGAKIKQGQDKLLLALASNQNVQLLIITGDINATFAVQKIAFDGVSLEYDFTNEMLNNWLLRWIYRCGKNPIEINIPNAERLEVYQRKRQRERKTKEVAA